MKLLVFILSDANLQDFLLEDWSNAGIKGATVINSTGMARALLKNSDNSLFSSLNALFDHGVEDSRTILCLLDEEKLEVAKKVIYDVVGDLSKPNTGVIFTIPVDDVEGVRR